jgi:pyruvate formate lyase activating enzyme
MRCRFCHNPDTWELKPDGKTDEFYTADELLDKAERYRTYWGKKGGITVSGGEPLLQLDFLIELFEKAHERGINTTLDTSAQPFQKDNKVFMEKFDRLMAATDLILLDLKHIDNERHKWETGHENTNILDCANYLSNIAKPVWIRHVLVPGVSDTDEYLHRLRDFISTLNNVEKIEILPYHTLGTFKWEELGIPYSLADTKPPTKERIENAEKILNGRE